MYNKIRALKVWLYGWNGGDVLLQYSFCSYVVSPYWTNSREKTRENTLNVCANAVISREYQGWLLLIGWLLSEVIVHTHFWEGTVCKYPLNQFLPIGKQIHQKPIFKTPWRTHRVSFSVTVGKQHENQPACEFPLLSCPQRSGHLAWKEIRGWIRCYRA